MQTLAASLLAVFLLTAGTGNAEAAHGKHRKAFKAPTTFEVAGVRCEVYAPDRYRIIVTWKVSGGRYVNLGRPQDPPTFGDKVTKGQTRYIEDVRQTRFGWPQEGGPTVPATFESVFQQTIAPLKNSTDSRRWRLITKTAPVTTTC